MPPTATPTGGRGRRSRKQAVTDVARPAAMSGRARDPGSAPYPSLADWIAVVLTVAIPLVYGHSWLSLDGDPGRHIRVGDTILRSGLFYRDPFSFTRAGARFVPYEWLSEVLSALSTRVAGLPGLLVLTGTVLATTYALVARTLLRRGAAPSGAWVTLLFVMALGVVHWHARPHIFTLLGAAMLMVLIDRASEQPPAQRRAILVGRVADGPALRLLGESPRRIPLRPSGAHGRCRGRSAGDARGVRRTPRRMAALIRHAAMLGVAVLAAMLTPSGAWALRSHHGLLRDTYLVDITQEYCHPTSTSPLRAHRDRARGNRDRACCRGGPGSRRSR